MNGQQIEQPIVNGRRKFLPQLRSSVTGDIQRSLVGRRTDQGWCRQTGAQHTLARRMQRKHNMVSLMQEHVILQRLVINYGMIHVSPWLQHKHRHWRRVDADPRMQFSSTHDADHADFREQRD